MTETAIENEEQRTELEAATALWEHLAAFAWDQFITYGVGVVLIEREDLLANREDLRLGRGVRIEPGFVPLTDIPPGDDFRALIRTIDPRRQIALLVRRVGDPEREDAEQLYVLEMLEGRRPPPEECYFARERPAETDS